MVRNTTHARCKYVHVYIETYFNYKLISYHGDIRKYDM